MLLGPVFRAELLRTGRRRRYYVLRFVYGAVLLLLVWAGYWGTFGGSPRSTIAAVARFAGETFVTFAIVQLATILVLIPPLFGGAIADEKQRKTLHYLMASRLSGGEIVLDKVLGRVPHLGIFLAMGLPIVCLLGLFGGIAAEHVAIAYVGTFATAMFAVALTVLVSTLARRVRQAVLISYVLVLAWLFLPTIFGFFGRALYPASFSWFSPILAWLQITSPFGVWAAMRLRSWRPGLTLGGPVDEFAWMVGLQLGGAAVGLLLAIWRLRPTFRRQEATPARRTWFGAVGARRRRRWLARPDCGDDAVLWKERYFAPNDIFTKLVLLPAVVVVTVPLVLVTEIEGGVGRAFVHLWRIGSTGQFFRDDLVWALRVDLGWYAAFWLLAVAGASASCVTIEREEDTWVSLTATPLTGLEIVRGKVLGAIWNQRGFGAVLVLIWLLGLLTGALHPMGVLASIAVVGVLTWFVAVLGVHASLRARSTSRTLTTTIVALGVFNAYPILLVWWFFGSLGWDSSFSLLGALPRLAAGPLVSYRDVDELWESVRVAGIFNVPSAGDIAVGLLLLTIDAGAACFLTLRVVGRFDFWLDRPRLSGAAGDGGPVTAPRAAEPALQP